MPDTGAPWNIPYVAGSDLVSDWPTDNQTMAEAVADALDDAFMFRQIQSATKVDTFTTTSTSYVDVTGLSVTITPKSNTSKVLVIAVLSVNPQSTAVGAMAILRGSTQIAGGTAAGVRRSATSSMYTNQSITNTPLVGVHLDSPATTSATTYKIQTVAQTGTVLINTTADDGNFVQTARTISSITVCEVA